MVFVAESNIVQTLYHHSTVICFDIAHGESIEGVDEGSKFRPTNKDRNHLLIFTGKVETKHKGTLHIQFGIDKMPKEILKLTYQSFDLKKGTNNITATTTVPLTGDLEVRITVKSDAKLLSGARFQIIPVS